MKEAQLFFFEDAVTGERVEFEGYVDEVRAEHLEEVIPALERLQRYQREQYVIAGAVAYEAGYVFFPKQNTSPTNLDTPFLHFYVFKTLKRVQGKKLLPLSEPTLFAYQSDTTKEEYQSRQEQIQSFIHSGEFYQLNQTLQKKFRSTHLPLELYDSLREQQKTKYCAFLDFDDYQVLSFSPELFFQKQGEKITTEPMKGTAPLTESPESLAQDEKSRAENLMIVDLLRNDLGRLAKPGTVKVEELFAIQKLSTVYQMTSKISAQMNANTSLHEILQSLFPCGSITGAPKWSAMKHISQKESSPRGYYTGALGFLDGQGNGSFNVAIRTVVHRQGIYTLGVGGGIVSDSQPEKEWYEAQLKARFARKLNSYFQIFETLLYDGQQFKNLTEHLQRLSSSAMYFDFEFDKEGLQKNLQLLQERLNSPQKIKIQIFWNGEIKISNQDILRPPGDRVGLAKERIVSTDIFRRHKTTQREVYDQSWEEAQACGLYDVLFLNENDELVEASRHNVFLKREGKWYTPPLSAGALPGIERASTLRDLQAVEKNLTLKNLQEAEELLLTNSVRGRVSVRWSLE